MPHHVLRPSAPATRRWIRHPAALLAAIAAAGCGGDPDPAPSPPPPPVTTPAVPEPVELAAGYVAATCPFDWRERFGNRERRGAGYLTPAAAARLRRSARARAGWDAAVVRTQAAGTCQILARHVLDEAPNSATRRYVRVVAQRRITRAGQPPATDEADYDLVVVLLGGRWLVERSSPGG